MRSKSDKIKRPVLRYHGGKFLLAKWIISNLPKHEIYVEVFGGAASVLMQKPRSYGEIYNDTWDTVVNVFRVLRDEKMAQELQRQIFLTPFSRSEFDICGEADLKEVLDPIEKARRTILRSFAGIGSAATNAEHSTGFRAVSRESGRTPAYDWEGYPENIKSFVERLRGVTIENKDFRYVIKQQDSPSTLFYLDPPYVQSTRNMRRGNAYYAHEMTDSDHIELAEILHGIKGMAVVSGYHSPLYDDLYGGWRKLEKKTHADGAADRTEVLWFSPSCVANQHTLFT